MKRKTIIKEWDDKGNLIKETIEEEEYDDAPATPYIPYIITYPQPINPYYNPNQIWKYEITCSAKDETNSKIEPI